MSSDALPITSARFAAALSDLPLASLRLKSLELRNSLAHLAYSNAQLRPFADGLQPGPDGTVRESEPDPDCIEGGYKLPDSQASLFTSTLDGLSRVLQPEESKVER